MLYYIGLGSNLGEREQTIRDALDMLDQHIGTRISVAPLIYSEPQGFDSPNRFCNTVALYESELQPTEVLAHTQSIERQLGRTGQSVILPDGSKRYADRLIDIDLIEAYDNNGIEVRMHTPALTLPHPRMLEREFVMEPLGIIKSHVINHT